MNLAAVPALPVLPRIPRPVGFIHMVVALAVPALMFKDCRVVRGQVDRADPGPEVGDRAARGVHHGAGRRNGTRWHPNDLLGLHRPVRLRMDRVVDRFQGAGR